MSDLQSYLDMALKKVKIEDIKEEPAVEQYDIEAEICKLVVTTRTSLGITQKQLAEKSGVTQANISKIENGTYLPSIKILNKIAQGLGKKLVVDFINREEGF